MNNNLNRYKDVQINTADQGRILLMMYEGAINFTKAAQTKILENDISGKSIYVNKSIGVISELMNSLDLEKGGEVAANLYKLYRFMIFQITNANIKNDKRLLDVTIKILEILNSAWVDIFNNKIHIETKEKKEPRYSSREMGIHI